VPESSAPDVVEDDLVVNSVEVTPGKEEVLPGAEMIGAAVGAVVIT